MTFEYPEPLMASLPSFPPMVGVFDDDPEIVEAVEGYISLAVDNTNISEETVNGWRLSYEFPDQSLTFSRGFALGRLWEKLRNHDRSDHVILTTWAQDAINLAKAQGWIASSEPLEEDAAWSYITFHEFKLHLVDQEKKDVEETPTV